MIDMGLGTATASQQCAVPVVETGKVVVPNLDTLRSTGAAGSECDVEKSEVIPLHAGHGERPRGYQAGFHH